MSALTWIDRARDRIDFRRSSEASSHRDWIGVDFSGEDDSRGAHKLLPLLVLALIVALGISALRIDLIRIRYAMASALVEEEELLAEQRRLIVRRRQLRDPSKLSVRAYARGFLPPTQILSLPEPVIAGAAFIEPGSLLSSIAAGPPGSQRRDAWQ